MSQLQMFDRFKHAWQPLLKTQLKRKSHFPQKAQTPTKMVYYIIMKPIRSRATPPWMRAGWSCWGRNSSPRWAAGPAAPSDRWSALLLFWPTAASCRDGRPSSQTRRLARMEERPAKGFHASGWHAWLEGCSLHQHCFNRWPFLLFELSFSCRN